jgi:hypothetical protein|tara:strand:+ start:1160 stop:1339 length:180 start_codon:yes stop_codon:yes gene_type:complete
MGRKRKYFTKKEKREAQRKWQMEYYERNSEQLKKEARDRYKLKRIEKIKEEKRKKLYGE